MGEGPFHAGEVAVQQQAGVQAAARRVGGIVQPSVAPALAAFLAQARLVVVAAADAGGTLWASPFAGAPGFVHASAPERVRVDARVHGGDPLAAALSGAGQARVRAGMVALDLATRRRVRINGTVTSQAGEAGFAMAVDQAYVNCPKYIQARQPPRAHPVEPVADAAAGAAAESSSLSAAQAGWIGAADTCFVATAAPGTQAPSGVDASHRGGAPGFVRVEAPDRLAMPDYAGNGMFNTLGNLHADSRIGLVFPDFRTGAVLHVAATAWVDWSPARAAGFPGAERVLEVRITRVLQRAGALAAGWDYLGASPFNPPAG